MREHTSHTAPHSPREHSRAPAPYTPTPAPGVQPCSRQRVAPEELTTEGADHQARGVPGRPEVSLRYTGAAGALERVWGGRPGSRGPTDQGDGPARGCRWQGYRLRRFHVYTDGAGWSGRPDSAAPLGGRVSTEVRGSGRGGSSGRGRAELASEQHTHRATLTSPDAAPQFPPLIWRPPVTGSQPWPVQSHRPESPKSLRGHPGWRAPR